jgi:hypothetical protein
MVLDIISFSGRSISAYSRIKEAQFKIIQHLWQFTPLAHRLKTFDEILNQKEVKITIDNVDVKDADKKLRKSLIQLWNAKQYQTFNQAACKT